MASSTRESRSSIRTSYSGDWRASARPQSSLAEPTSGAATSTTSTIAVLSAIALQKRSRSLAIGNPPASIGSAEPRGLHAEYGAHAVGLERLIGTGVRNYLAPGKDDDTLAICRGQIQVVRDRNDQHSAAAQLAEDSIEPDLVLQVEKRCRLIQKQRFGGLSQRGGQDDALLLTAAERAKVAIAECRGVRQLHRVPDGGVVGFAFEESSGVRRPAHQDDLFRRERKLDSHRLRHDRYTPGELAPVPQFYFLAVEVALSLVAFPQASENAEQSGFPGAVRPHNRRQIGWREIERDASQDLCVGVSHAGIAELKPHVGQPILAAAAF